MKSGIKQIIGKIISGVIVKESGGSPRQQVFLIFNDGTYFELYGNSITCCSGLNGGTADDVRRYMADSHKIVVDSQESE